MRRALFFCLLAAAACAPRAKPADQQQWIELQSEHFVLRTDLAEPAAREAVEQLELVRASLIAVAWHAPKAMSHRLMVVDLASDAELREFAGEGIEGFVASDAFGERMLVMSAEQSPEELTVLKHEMAHVLSNEFLLRNPRWLAEGIACYLETLRFDGPAHTVVVGEPGKDRLAYLGRFPVPSFQAVFQMGSEAVSLTPEAGFAWESAAWLVVHFLANERKDRFESFLARLAKGEDPARAYAKEFPDLGTEEALQAQIGRYLREGQYVRSSTPQPKVSGEASVRGLPRAEVHAMRADLLRISPGVKRDASAQRAEIALALQDDPGNPLALQLADQGDAEAATKAHPDDWRAWVVYADRHDNDAAAIARALKLAPDNAGVLGRMAWAENAAGRRKKAIEYARRANELAPGRSVHLDTLASLLAGAGRCDEAIGTERRAIEVLPDTAPKSISDELRARLSQMQLKCGRQPERIEMAQNDDQPDTEPVRKSCGQLTVVGPVTVTAEYTVREDGSVGDVQVTGNASQAVLKAFRAFVRSCSYEPATRGGKPVAARIKQDLSVGKR
ncbi:MAG TPA: hypothetical protein VLW85_01830 [Myxococcales bacterium]|nr:hypothetical protein [Myxococcales bacterium]